MPSLISTMGGKTSVTQNTIWMTSFLSGISLELSEVVEGKMVME